MKILVTGANGQLGSEVRKLSGNYPYNFVFTNSNELNFLNLNSIKSSLNLIKPNIIINCAAYTSVDNAEKELFLSDTINHRAINLIAEWTSENNCKLIHISTDYVFDGTSKIPLTELATTKPINVYGKTKLLGEKACLKNNPNTIIIRTSWLYSSFGVNFVKTILALMKDKDSLNIINDQIGSPTYAADLANAIFVIINNDKWIPGIYNYSNEGEISWYQFANSIKELTGLKTHINSILSEEFSTTAKRPKYSLLDKTKIKKTFKIEVPPHKISLEKCIKILKNEA